MDLSPFQLNEEDHTSIKDAIRSAERIGNYELRVCIDRSNNIDLFDRAAYIFEKLNMHKTKLRNGVLIYLSLSSKRFCIIGDQQAHNKFTQAFWDKIVDETQSIIREKNLKEGILFAIKQLQKALQFHFPIEANDQNELSDEIHFEN
ncbi:MAG TPA: TPM domain-containing protein [Bacteroidia bacterium]|nr:TPM domain-containing protein [Bacteroidia bacterium]HNT79376.1 TPM domain-containing protein [Bacteroidia bacterium]